MSERNGRARPRGRTRRHSTCWGGISQLLPPETMPENPVASHRDNSSTVLLLRSGVDQRILLKGDAGVDAQSGLRRVRTAHRGVCRPAAQSLLGAASRQLHKVSPSLLDRIIGPVGSAQTVNAIVSSADANPTTPARRRRMHCFAAAPRWFLTRAERVCAGRIDASGLQDGCRVSNPRCPRIREHLLDSHANSSRARLPSGLVPVWGDAAISSPVSEQRLPSPLQLAAFYLAKPAAKIAW